MTRKKNSAKNPDLCQFWLIIILLSQKAFNFLIFYLFLSDLKIGLYPYRDIQDSFSSNVISSKALAFKFFCSLLGIILSFSSIIICLYGLKRKGVKYFFKFLLILSSLELILLSGRFLELNKIVSLVENCDFHHQVQVGCSIPPDKF